MDDEYFQEEAAGFIDRAVSDGRIDPSVAENIDLSGINENNWGDIYERAIKETSVITGGAPGDTLDDQYWQRREDFAFNGGLPYSSGMSDKGTVGFGTPVDSDHFEDAFGPAGKDMVKHVKNGGVITQEAADHLYSSSAHRTEAYLRTLRSDPGARWSEAQHFAVLSLVAQNGGKMPSHLVEAYKSGDAKAFGQAILDGKFTTGNDMLGAYLTASQFVGFDQAADYLNRESEVTVNDGGRIEAGKGTVLPFDASGVTVSSGYGDRFHPTLKVQKKHNGLDFTGMKLGDKIGAVRDGKVIQVGREKGWGNFVKVQHGDGTVTVYAHLDTITAQENQKVRAGDYLGGAGSTGRSTGTHLHLEWWKDATGKNRMDPSGLFDPAVLKKLTRRRRKR